MNYRYHIDRNRCKGCGLCVAVCPKQVLRISDEINDKGYFPVYQAKPGECVFCATCCTMCPEVALTITEAPRKMANPA